MADVDAAAGAENQQSQPLSINAQYTKGLSFEVPGAPMVFAAMQNAQPDININIEVNARPLQENVYEVEIAVNASCDIDGDTGFILEFLYAGLFTINVPEEHLQAILLIECPRLLFPFARNIIADVTRDGGFPPVMLGQVDFVGMYQQQMEAACATNGEAEA